MKKLLLTISIVTLLGFGCTEKVTELAVPDVGFSKEELMIAENNNKIKYLQKDVDEMLSFIDSLGYVKFQYLEPDCLRADYKWTSNGYWRQVNCEGQLGVTMTEAEWTNDPAKKEFMDNNCDTQATQVCADLEKKVFGYIQDN